ncbi:MAG: ABC-2 family transporter protein [Clostridiales bacterium]|nr:ABC-2 family transporter protein [Clostridiales bacterium]
MFNLDLIKKIIQNSVKREMMFRFNIVMCFLLFFIGYSIEILYFYSIYDKVEFINGWSQYELFSLLGVIFVIDSLFFGLIFFNVLRIPFMVKRYELDSIILKPVNSLFYLSTKSINLGYLLGVVPGIIIISYSLVSLNINVSWYQLIYFFMFLINSLLILSSIFIIFISTTLYLVKVDGMISMFWSIANFGKKPGSIYPMLLKQLLLFVMPMLVVYNIPSEILFGKFYSPLYFIFPIIIVFVANIFWNFGLKKYYA